MSGLDLVLVNAFPMLVAMSLVAVIVPTVRHAAGWQGITLAWLATFIVGMLVALTHQDAWGLSCSWLNMVRSDVTGVTAFNASGPCTASSALPPWLVAAPSLVGIAVMTAWAWRHARPSAEAKRIVGAWIVLALVVVGAGQVSANLPLLVVAAVAVAVYAWPRLHPQPAT